jgi:hypothetical protein
MAGSSRPGVLTAPLFASLASIMLTLVIAPAAVAQNAVLNSVDSCISRLNPDVDVGYQRIAVRCPELIRRLEQSVWSGWLPPDWKQPGNDLSAGGLRELRDLLARESALHERARAPSLEPLPDILAGLAPPHHEVSGWWDRAKAWLHETFQRREQTADPDWLTRMADEIGPFQRFVELISYIALTLVIVLAVFIVVNELRVSGVLGRLRGRFAHRNVLPTRLQGNDPAWDDVQAAPLRQQPRLLLERVVARLTEDSCLPPARGLTVHELTRAARLPDENDRNRFAELARTAEHVRFSSAEIPNDVLAAAVVNGRALLERISPRAPPFQGGSS